MANNVVAFTGETTLDINPDTILASAMGQYPGGVIVLGYDEEGKLMFQTSFGEARDFIWPIKTAEHQFMAAVVL